jgi:hypothetical protein
MNYEVLPPHGDHAAKLSIVHCRAEPVSYCVVREGVI